eukprot:Protomagalhaensia_sp_Gyna_25__3091@NODE_2837_length_865_cov_7_372881_g2367_i0_p1_GENE_NODE_2837_length_865_cov_7_372881_g2367_i0NODE_2837_length_865_cov_7_372881_g2367_i0_p1_ORF_typecomplete_len134_score9_18_NODE_2837_length_865_cov_7_372881_g2367_i077478
MQLSIDYMGTKVTRLFSMLHGLDQNEEREPAEDIARQTPPREPSRERNTPPPTLEDPSLGPRHLRNEKAPDLNEEEEDFRGFHSPQTATAEATATNANFVEEKERIKSLIDEDFENVCIHLNCDRKIHIIVQG